MRTPDDAVSLTWSELLERVDAVAGGLAKLGVGKGDAVAIMLGNRPEFHIADLAAVTLGATPFSIYVTYPPEEIQYLCRDSGVPRGRSSSRRTCPRSSRRARASTRSST